MLNIHIEIDLFRNVTVFEAIMSFLIFVIYVIVLFNIFS